MLQIYEPYPFQYACGASQSRRSQPLRFHQINTCSYWNAPSSSLTGNFLQPCSPCSLPYVCILFPQEIWVLKSPPRLYLISSLGIRCGPQYFSRLYVLSSITIWTIINWNTLYNTLTPRNAGLQLFFPSWRPGDVIREIDHHYKLQSGFTILLEKENDSFLQL